jgi:hypothetical protein
MSNTLGVYDPIFYAQEALIQLRKALGMASRIHRGYDKVPQQKGSVISIPKPSTFTASAVNTSTGGTTQNITTDTVNITLDQWYEVKFALTEKELSATGERIITDHVAPAAYALADNIDQAISGMYKYVPWTASAVISDVASFLAARKILFDNNVPMNDGNLHCMLGSTAEAALLALQAFSQIQGAGDMAKETLLRGTLGVKFGVETFANQNTPSHTSGAHADTAGVCSGTIGATTLTVTSLTTGQAVKAGDNFSIAGDTQKYVFTADGTATSPGTLAAIGIYPALKTSPSAAVVTLNATATTAVQNLMFHRNFAALAMAPLSEIGSSLGARIATVTDPITGLSLRSRLFYDGDKNTIKVALDVLYGVKILDGNLAVRAGVA